MMVGRATLWVFVCTYVLDMNDLRAFPRVRLQNPTIAYAGNGWGSLRFMFKLWHWQVCEDML